MWVANIRVIKYMLHIFKSDLNIKETATNISENYTVNRPCLESET